MDLGPPISYQVLATGTKVLSCDGTDVGEVAHVLAVEAEDVFDGIVIAERAGSGHRFADADDIQEIHQRAVVLKLDHDASMRLPEPSANPAVMSDDPTDPGSGELISKLKRAWDRLSGNY